MSAKPEAWMYYWHAHAERDLASLADDGWQVSRATMTATKDGREIRLFVIQSTHDTDRLRGHSFSGVRVQDQRVALDAQRIAMRMIR